MLPKRIKSLDVDDNALKRIFSGVIEKLKTATGIQDMHNRQKITY